MENVAYNFTLIYDTYESLGRVYSFCITVYDISYFQVLSMKDLINKDYEPTTPFKLATCLKKISITFMCVLFPCVARESIAHIGKRS